MTSIIISGELLRTKQHIYTANKLHPFIKRQELNVSKVIVNVTPVGRGIYRKLWLYIYTSNDDN